MENGDDIIKLAGVERYRRDWNRLYFEENKRFIIKHNGAHQIHYSAPAGFSTTHIIKTTGYMRRNRHWVVDAEGVNNHFGKKMLIDWKSLEQ